MDSNNNKKLLFNNLEEYQCEVERLEEIIKNQAILIEDLSESKTGFRKGEIMPLIIGAGSYHKTIPRFGTPYYEQMMKNKPIIFELGDGECFKERMESIFQATKGLEKQTLIHIKDIENIGQHLKHKSDKPIKDLLLKQSKGQFLTKEEKDRCTKHAEEVRKQRKK